MRKLKILTIALTALVLLSGCAVKQTDNMATKAIKHTVMTPIYVGEALDKGVKLAAILPLALVVKGIRVLQNEDNKETKKDIQ